MIQSGVTLLQGPYVRFFSVVAQKDVLSLVNALALQWRAFTKIQWYSTRAWTVPRRPLEANAPKTPLTKSVWHGRIWRFHFPVESYPTDLWFDKLKLLSSVYSLRLSCRPEDCPRSMSVILKDPYSDGINTITGWKAIVTIATAIDFYVSSEWEVEEWSLKLLNYGWKRLTESERILVWILN